MNPDVEKFVKTSKQWKEEISELRSIILSTKLEENYKWNLPCYCDDNNNIVIIQPFKASLALMFFKGALLKDTKGLLAEVGPNTKSGRRFEFTSLEEIKKLKPTIKAYIKEAVAIEKAGIKVESKKTPETLPDELKAMFEKKSAFKKAFESLTPGRQRAYILHFAGAKQSATRLSRIEKCMPDILKGKGVNDR